MSRISVIPLFVTGKTKEELVVNMLKNNASKLMYFNYFGIQKDGDEWVAWYFCDMEGDALREIKPVESQ